jgi:hypothetical protein
MMRSTPKKTSMNFEGGVNKKHTTDTASCAQAEKGEQTKPYIQFQCDSAPKGRSVRPGPQVNFPN